MRDLPILLLSHKAGTYGNQKALLYSVSIVDTFISGGIFDKEKDRHSADDGKHDIIVHIPDLQSANNTMQVSMRRAVKEWSRTLMTRCQDGSNLYRLMMDQFLLFFTTMKMILCLLISREAFQQLSRQTLRVPAKKSRQIHNLSMLQNTCM